MGPDADSGTGGPGASGTGARGAGAGRAGTSGTRASRAGGGGGATAGRGPAQSGPPDLDALSKADLLARAAELDIPGRSKMSKPELIKAIQAAGRPKRRARKIS
jgi:DNA end-binding protein Ku